MKKVKQHEKQRPRYGDNFAALFITDNDKRRAEHAHFLATIGHEIRYCWRSTDSGPPLDARKPLDDVDTVIFDGSASINTKVKRNVEYTYKVKEKKFVISDALSPKDIVRRLEKYGFAKDAIEAPVVEEIAAPDIGTEMPPPDAGETHVENAPEPEPTTTDEGSGAEAAPAETAQPTGKADVKRCNTAAQAGALITRYRETRGWTRKELAEEIGVSPSYMYNIEGGKMSPSEEICGLLEHVFNFPRGTLPRLGQRRAAPRNRMLKSERDRLIAESKANAETAIAPESAPPPPPPPPLIPEPVAAPEAPIVAPAPAPVEAQPAPVAAASPPKVKVVAVNYTPAQLVEKMSADEVVMLMSALRRRLPDLGMLEITVSRKRGERASGLHIEWDEEKTQP